MELNEKQKRFCEEYVKHYNASRAGLDAGYSEKTAHVQANRLLKLDKVQEYVKQLQKEYKQDNISWIEELIKLRNEAVPVFRGLLSSRNDMVRLRVCEQLFQLDKLDLSDDKPEEDNF